MPEYVLGIDVSRHQGEMDWATAYFAGARYAYIRAGSITQDTGELYVDDQFYRNADEAPPIMPCGYYFYFRPQYDPIAQADFFSALIHDKVNNLRPMVDVETTGGLNSTTVASRVMSFLVRLESNFSKIQPAIYTRMSFWNPYVARSDLWKKYDLWVARYSNLLTSPWSDGWYEPLDWPLDGWDFWQWSADGNLRGPEFGASGSQSIDIDRFNGDEAAFQAYLDVINPPPPPPPPEVTMIVSDSKNTPAVKGRTNVEFVVPDGEEWNLQAIHLYMQYPCIRARFGVKSTSLKTVFISDVEAQSWDPYLTWTGQLTLVPGEVLIAAIDNAPEGTTITFAYRGIKTLIPTP